MNGAALIAAERKRQIEVEGYDAAHDEGADDNLALAAACYTLPAAARPFDHPTRSDPPMFWPWHAEYWRPTPDDRVRELTKAGALIAAAIDSLIAEAT